ncbi:similar to monooxygenase FAD-binding [Plenodomus lingam JN3]|uniref:Similar to monooxygenase FAD-binding n=2 Tax=Leptosphaeria maculans TaxID=5022 RepID=E4ZIJ0_LEPMJ|nr:similar to monooxygenase FAD-binding [Plenodomus lingam JN3]CBX91011.1 similar to monooxygenase FAD-binding [Plenodomus lingam JN3]
MIMPLLMNPDVVVIGASISGLMHALVLRSTGRSVVVLEARSQQQIQAIGAGLSFWPNAQRLLTMCIPDMHFDSWAVKNSTMEILTRDGLPVIELPISEDIWTSSWSAMREKLVEACEQDVPGYGTVQIWINQRVCDLVDKDDHINVIYRIEDGPVKSVAANLVIAADGARSFVRNRFLPNTSPKYAGYLAWRGRFPESEAPRELDGALAGKMAFFMFDGSYILAYLAPDANGSMVSGDRYIEWCWYDACDVSSPEFSEYMTDRYGMQHNMTVSADLLHPKTWAAQLSRRKDVVPPIWQSLFAKSTLPLLTAIHSFDNDHAAFYSGKLLLAGEAYTQIRPHLGASCDIAALQAILLPEVLDGRMSIVEWERTVAIYARNKSIGSAATGEFGMTGKWPDGYVATFARP